MAAGYQDNEEFKQALRAAMRAEAPATNLGGWIDRQADKLEITPKLFAAWLYADNAPESLSLMALFGHFGPDFTNRLLEKYGLRSAHLEDCRAIDDANALGGYRTMADKIEAVLADARAKDGGS